jgi:hypothetical protein
VVADAKKKSKAEDAGEDARGNTRYVSATSDFGDEGVDAEGDPRPKVTEKTQGTMAMRPMSKTRDPKKMQSRLGAGGEIAIDVDGEEDEFELVSEGMRSSGTSLGHKRLSR